MYESSIYTGLQFQFQVYDVESSKCTARVSLFSYYHHCVIISSSISYFFFNSIIIIVFCGTEATN